LVLTGGLGTAALMQATASLTLAAPDGSRGQLLGLPNAGLTTVMGVAPFAAGALATRLGTANTVGVVGLTGLALAAPLTLVWRRVRPTMAVVEG
jgi:hypothetical protein